MIRYWSMVISIAGYIGMLCPTAANAETWPSFASLVERSDFCAQYQEIVRGDQQVIGRRVVHIYWRSQASEQSRSVAKELGESWSAKKNSSTWDYQPGKDRLVTKFTFHDGNQQLLTLTPNKGLILYPGPTADRFSAIGLGDSDEVACSVVEFHDILNAAAKLKASDQKLDGKLPLKNLLKDNKRVSKQAKAAAPLQPRTTSPQGRGSLTGRFVFNSKPPAPKKLVAPVTYTDPFSPPRRPSGGWSGWNKYKDKGLVDESLVVAKDGGIKNVVIWLRSKDVPIPKNVKPGKPPVMQTKGGRFEPHMLAFYPPQKLQLKNDQDTGVNMLWRPLKNDAFNVMMNKNSNIKVDINQSEILPTSITSNLMLWAKAYVFPCPNPYFAVSSTDGRFRIDNLPPGEWEFQVWHERRGYVKTPEWVRGRFTMKINPGNNDLGTIKLLPKNFFFDAELKQYERKQAIAGNSLLPHPMDDAALIAHVEVERLGPAYAQKRIEPNMPWIVKCRVKDVLRSDVAKIPAEIQFYFIHRTVVRNRLPIISRIPIEAKKEYIVFLNRPKQPLLPGIQNNFYFLKHGEFGVLPYSEFFMATFPRDEPDLHQAALHGNLKLVQQLIAKLKDVDVRDKEQRTPLMLAVLGGHLQIVNELITRGADPDATDMYTSRPMHFAAQSGQTEIVELLIKHGAQVDAPLKNQRTPLSLAAMKGHLATVKLLLANKAKLDQPDQLKRTPLIWAAHFGKIEVIRELVRRGANVNAKSYGDWTALHFAVRENYPKAAKLLVELGADANARNSLRQRPFDIQPKRRPRFPEQTLLQKLQSRRIVPDSDPKPPSKPQPKTAPTN